MIDIIDFVRFWFETGRQVLLDVEGVSRIRIGEVLVVGVFGDVVLAREKRPHPAQLQNALAAVQHGQFVDAHQLLSEFLVVQTVGNLTASAFPGVEGVDGLLPKGF